jgi:hypothetical protein
MKRLLLEDGAKWILWCFTEKAAFDKLKREREREKNKQTLGMSQSQSE